MRPARLVLLTAAVYAVASSQPAFAAPPANDAFASAQVLAASGAVAAGDTREATREDLEPNHDLGGGDASVWYQVTPAATGAVEINVCDASFDTAIAAYQGNLGALTERAAGECRIAFAVIAAQTYKIAVDGRAGEQGTFTLRLESFPAPANDNLAAAEVISGSAVNVEGDNRGASHENNEPFFGGGDSASVWYRWTAPFSGAARVGVCDGSLQRVGIYTGDAHGSLTQIDRGPCERWFSAVSGTTYQIAVDFRRARFHLRLDAFAKPANDDFASAELLSGSSLSFPGDNRGASIEAAEGNHGSGAGGPTGDGSLWYRWTAPFDGAVELNLCTTNTDIDVSLYTGTTINGLTAVTDPDTCLLRGRIQAGTEYRIAMQTDNSNEARGTFVFHLEAYPKPANDDFAAAQPITGASARVPGDVRGSHHREVSEPDHVSSPDNLGMGSVWYRWQAPVTGRVRIDVCADTITGDFGIAAYTGTTLAFNGLTKVVGFRCAISFLVTEGTTYQIAVEGRAGDRGTFVLNLETRTTRPDNDDYANARLLTGAAVTSRGDNFLATYETDEPLPEAPGDGGSVWFEWVAPYSGSLRYDLCGTSYRNARTKIYTGASLATLAFLNGVGVSSTSCFAPTIPVTAGTRYSIVVDGRADGFNRADRYGEYVLNLNLTDNVRPETTITTPAPVQPSDPSFEFRSSESDSSFECSLDGANFTACGSPQPYPGLAPGVHTFRVRATDPRGNVDLSPAETTFDVDNERPGTSIVDDPGEATADSTPRFGYSSPDPDARFRCRIDSGPFAACDDPTAIAGADAEFTSPVLAEGSHRFEVRAVDPAGNEDQTPAVSDFVVDTSPPTVSVNAVPTDEADQTPTFRYSSSEPRSSFSCRIDADRQFDCSDASADPSSDAELTTIALADGEHNLEVRAIDAAGNTGPAATQTFTIDTSDSGEPDGGVGPETTLGKGPKKRTKATARKTPVKFKFLSPVAGATFECSLQSKRKGEKLTPPLFTPCSSPQSYKVKLGQYLFQVRAVAEGVPDSTPARVGFKIVPSS